MKKIRIIELLANIRSNIIAFFSISMFVCLGIGLFLGIQWGAVALRNAYQESLEKGNMHDIEISFPYGITQSDLKKIEEIDGVSAIEYGYSSYAVMKDGSTSYTLKMQSMPNDIDKPIAVVGNLPMENNEVALLKKWAEKKNIGIGDTVSLKHDATDDDADGMQYLRESTFTVTALVDSPAYLYNQSTAYGVSNIGSGDVDCVAFVKKDVFDAEKYRDGYPSVYIRCSSLDGISTFSDEYKNKISPIVDKLTELGGTLGTARYNEIHDDAQTKIEDAQKKLNEGEGELAKGQQQLADGEKALEEGKEQLEVGQSELINSVTSATTQQGDAQRQLEAAYKQLADGQAQYDAGLQTYNAAANIYNQLHSKFESIRPTYDELMGAYSSLNTHYSTLVSLQNQTERALDSYKAAPEEEKEAQWAEVASSYQSLYEEYRNTVTDFNSLNRYLNAVGDVLGFPLSINDLAAIMAGITPEDADATLAASQLLIDSIGDAIGKINRASIDVSGTTISLADLPGGFETAYDALEGSRVTLEESKQRLDAGWAEYNAAKSAYDKAVSEGQQQLQSGEKALEDGRTEIADKTKELEEGKATLSDKTKELEEGKVQFEDAKSQFDKLVSYEWVIMPRQDNGSVQGVSMVAGIMDSVKWAMASLFILVGLFVCYSAISRLVHEQIIQIGTKKALGFHANEVSAMYLSFSGLAVAIGLVASVALAILLVQGIMNPTAMNQVSIPPFDPYFGPIDLAVVGAVELILILLATRFAISSLLKRNAVDLLRGESTANVKEHWYERTRVWQKMSLFSQTVVNNCVNDKRRVIGTLVGVIGCTALIVTAVTLSGNLTRSLDSQYSKVYNYDSIAYLSEDSYEAAGSVALALYNRGIASAPVFERKMQVRQDDGTRSLTTLVVPTNDDSFNKFYHVHSTSGGEAKIENGGLWVSAAYAEHQGAEVGDEIMLTEFSGKAHKFKIAGFFDYYLLRQEFVLSQREYREAFGEKPMPNALLVNLDGADMSRTREALAGAEGYNSLVDDKENASYAFNQMTGIMNKVVIIYLVLSGLMALMVLMNLYVMFVQEKKRELIVLMICGFSTDAAQAYIYRDSILLTIIGIILGIVLGAVMGAVSLFALEPSMGYFIKGFNVTAAVVGAVGAAAFSAGVLIYALRLIPRFNLTDINRF